jgi:predicted AlkP superfamily pyrophosphatase or phosphodiesterase
MTVRSSLAGLRRPLVALALCALLTACPQVPRTTPPPPETAVPAADPAAIPALPDGDALVLVSLDGVHPGALGQGHSPTLDRLAAGGVRAEAMRPSFPSLTFPNHYTLVTGLRPDRHGIVDNRMLDRELGRFGLSDRAAVGDARWWGGEPLWLGLQRAGGRAATMFWPGSEAPIGGDRPRWWFPFDKAISPEARVDQVLAWLELPAAERPRFITLYFEHVDEAGHDHGPDSPEAVAALQRLDAALARLVDGIDARGAAGRTHLVVVSDHGMATVPPGQVLALDDWLDLEAVDVVTMGQLVGVNPRRGRRAEVERALLQPRAHLACHRRGETPPGWHYGAHPRVPRILCLVEPGWRVGTRASLARWAHQAHATGAHGYDPAHPSMQAMFIARGPAFAEGVVLPAFDNVHVYPLLAGLLGFPPADNDGDAAVLRPALRATAPAAPAAATPAAD